MKLGKGKNQYIFNQTTMMAIIQQHLSYHTDQIVTSVETSGETFVVSMNDKPVPENKAESK